MIDLSCDLGEPSTDAERETESRIWPLIGSANVACGGHAGDEASMADAARRARELGTKLGPHPSYPDREHFGRRTMAISTAGLRESLASQIASLRDIAMREGVVLRRVKPHGALYNEAHHDHVLASAIIDAMRDVDVTL